MKSMNIAASSELVSRLSTHRRVVALGDTDFTDVAAVVITAADSRSGILTLLKRTGFHLPVFLYSEHAVELPAGVTAVINGNEQHWLELESAACQYEENLLPPFYDTLTQYVEMGNSTFACPGHQHGAFFKKHPAGRHFYDFFGENVFRADMCNADVKLGDLLIHEGSAKDAQKFAAKVFHADKTYFVLNGTSAANKVVTNALLTRGDLVLFDRNNHKSNHHGALIQAGATPVYLEASRNPFGFIGGIDAHCFNEEYLRQQIRDVAPEKADLPRPFRLAIIQLGTYDGTVYNARQVIDTVGHLCDYILFDSAWVGYEQFIPMMADSSPLAEVLPSVYNKYPVRYRDYTLRQLCQEMHDLYVSFDVKDLQKAMFRQQSFPSVVMNPQDAHSAYIRGDVELVRIRDAEGRIAAEGALPYPPGVLCVVPGEVWGGAVQRYFLALEEGVNLLPGFSPELQGVYSETDADGMKRLYGYVLK
ncbi:TPA: hypothetical protein PBR34_004510 [Escherichia coli]|nr:hypothetical protein [Escherichia coli]HDD9898116.1 hypothetical protein [Escherichia coli]